MQASTSTALLPEEILSDLRIEDEDGDYYAATGITLSFMYAQRMATMVDVFRQMVEVFSDYMLPLALDSKCRDEWTDYNPKQLKRLLNKFAAYAENGEEMVLAKLDAESPFQYFGEFGLRILGRSDEKDSPFRGTDVCALYIELPMREVDRVGQKRVLELIRNIAALAPFQHGMCGYSFKYFHREGDDKIYRWMGDKGLRYFAIHPIMNNFEYYCRHELPNVNWVTLLGQEMTDKLGGTATLRQALSEAVDVEPLPHGTMLIAGQTPPLGDRNALALDLGPLREVARLTRPLLLNRKKMGKVLGYIFEGDDEEERIDRWLNRFNWKPGMD
ncbi:MAG: DUF3396 domain-containing protein [Rhizobacter sp.]